MLANLSIRNFQSLRRVDLELGKFTVIVGPSSSGKSALMRALRVLASNSRGASYVTHGEKIASVTASDLNWVATIERGEGHGKYQLSADGEEKTFTKLGGTVPEEVTAVLGIEPAGSDGSSLHFAAQFDRPYLLDDSGQQVARTLGELTNVSVIFDASREANRRRLAANSTLKTRQADLAQLQEQAQLYRNLPARIAALTEAEEFLVTSEKIDQQRTRLASAVSELRMAEAVLESLSTAEVVVPDFEPVARAQDRLTVFKTVLAELSKQVRAQNAAIVSVGSAEELEDQLDEQFHAVLHEAGTCPTCGQSTKELASA